MCACIQQEWRERTKAPTIGASMRYGTRKGPDSSDPFAVRCEPYFFFLAAAFFLGAAFFAAFLGAAFFAAFLAMMK